MKKKLLSVIVAIVVTMISLLSTGVTVYAQSEEVEQKIQETIELIDSVGVGSINIDEELRDLVRAMIALKDEDLAKGLECLEYLDKIQKIITLVKQYNDKNERKGGIVGFAQAYSDYSLAMQFAFDDPMNEEAIDKAIIAGCNLSDAAIQAFVDDLTDAVGGIYSGYKNFDGLEKLGQLAILTEILCEYQTVLKEAEYIVNVDEKRQIITDANEKLGNSAEWRAYLESKNIDIPETTPTVTPTVTPTITPTATPTNSSNDVIHFECADLEAAIRLEINKPTGDILRRDVKYITKLMLNTSNTFKAKYGGNGYKYIYSGKIDDIKPLRYFENLSYLIIEGNLITDFSVLNDLPNLTFLMITDCKTINAEFNKLPSLKSLTIYVNGSDSELNATNYLSINNLNKLHSLELTFGDKVTDLSLNQLPSLKSLKLSGNKLSDMSSLGNFTNLEYLYLGIYGATNIKDFSFLQNLTNLTKFIMHNCQISDISFLKNLTNLTYMSLPNNQISDISVLKNLTNLTDLDLGYNQISDISSLQNLTNLTDLNLDDNQISDISSLQNLTNLTRLRLENNQISDISFLHNLTNLRDLDLSENPINNKETPNAVHKSELDFSIKTLSEYICKYEVWVVEEKDEIIKGDIDGNGVFNSIDFAMMRLFIIGEKTDFTEEQLEAADVDSNGAVNSIDFAIMRQVILGTRAGF